MSSHDHRRGSRRAEVLIGRALAAAVHPQDAWRSREPSFRLLLVATYFIAGYAGMLAALALR